jgi:hypothetical protein
MKMPSIQVGLGLSPRSSIQVDFGYPKRNASLSVDFTGSLKIALIFAGFMVFNFMTNLGPNAQTYLLAGEVFPTAIRGAGAGFAAAFAKIGAVATAFLFPILLVAIGARVSCSMGSS